MWSVTNWPLYLITFIVQVLAGLGWVVWHTWPKGAQKTIEAVWTDLSPVVITAAALSLVLTELLTAVPRVWAWTCRKVVRPLRRQVTQARRWVVRKIGQDVIDDEQRKVLENVVQSLREALRGDTGGTHGTSPQDR